MNALANSQQAELKDYLANWQGPPRVTFRRYTGQEKEHEREEIRRNPPDILLTNFMMLELLLTRQDDLNREVIDNCRGLSFIVLDELHTYRGRQGADVALLMRRLKERLLEPGQPVQCVGTSATMATGNDAERNDAVAEVTSKIFGESITPASVVTETLERATDREQTAARVAPKLGAAIDSLRGDSPRNLSNAAIAGHPLAIWIETVLGLRFEGKWRRARPRTIAEAAEELSVASGRSAEDSRSALELFLHLSSLPEQSRGGGEGDAFFAFKLHRFIAGAGRLSTTIDIPGQRVVTTEAQQFDPAGDGTRRLYQTFFCRNCGQEHHPVRLVQAEEGTAVVMRDIDDSPLGDQDDAEAEGRNRFGFLMPEPGDGDFAFSGRDEDYPELRRADGLNERPDAISK
jgi:DEAD/DEAH box helicase